MPGGTTRSEMFKFGVNFTDAYAATECPRWVYFIDAELVYDLRDEKRKLGLGTRTS